MHVLPPVGAEVAVGGAHDLAKDLHLLMTCTRQNEERGGAQKRLKNGRGGGVFSKIWESSVSK